jgi:GMP synthase (glutamine-hydrolysing)
MYDILCHVQNKEIAMSVFSSRSTIAIIRHLTFEDLGAFSPVLRNMDCTQQILDAGIDELTQPIESSDLVIVLGGPIGVYESDRYPFLATEQKALARRIDLGLPTLGICLGAQLIAAAAGAQVYPGHTKEIGWGKIKLTEQGENSCLSVLEEAPVLHWHGDTFDLPVGATCLAGNTNYPHQAFALGANILGLQFHPEIDTKRIEQWLIGHAFELNTAGIDPVVLRQQSRELEASVALTAEHLLTAWLNQLDIPQAADQLIHYQRKLAYETDSADLFSEMTEQINIVVVDTRSADAFNREHIPSAINIPHRTMDRDNTKRLDKRATYITYCDGIGCNASTRGAVKLSKLGFHVKELIGGLDWWRRDGYETKGSQGHSGKSPGCGC